VGEILRFGRSGPLILRAVAIGLEASPSAERRGKRGRRWTFLLVLGGLVVVVLLLLTAVVVLSGAKLANDPTALARVRIQPFGGRLASARAVDPSGRTIALAVAGGRLTPQRKLAPGTVVTVEVALRRPGWDAWLIGRTRKERLTVRAPVAQVRSRWITGSPVQVAFSQPVARVAYAVGSQGRRTATGMRRALSIPTPTPGGTVRIALAARTWERLGRSTTVHYFPQATRPVALIAPAPSGRLNPGDQLRLTLSQPVQQALGSATPKLSPSIPGHWTRTGDHTLVFTPSGFGAPLGSHVRLTLPHTVAAADATGRGAKTTRQIAWTVPPASPLRLVQLLADAGYLPVDFKPSGGDVPRTARAQASAATDPPQGRFAWRYAHTPHELEAQWAPRTDNVVVKGAIMMFEDEHHMTVDGLPGPALWKALLADELAGKRRSAGYSYVYVHRDLPQLLTLWHAGRTLLTSPGNTGVPAAPTQLGTFPVFEHLAVTTMSGTNPDGSHYKDPGIKWVSYFNGGDALHAFNRASFGTPQSLGCVELPEASAARIWPYTPIGTLVTIEN
jgi:L,D-transpeptidase catalytic domain